MTSDDRQKNDNLESIMCHKVSGMTVDKIMNINHLNEIDILKIDIEGSEKEVFMDSSHWIDKVNILSYMRQ